MPKNTNVAKCALKVMKTGKDKPAAIVSVKKPQARAIKQARRQKLSNGS